MDLALPTFASSNESILPKGTKAVWRGKGDRGRDKKERKEGKREEIREGGRKNENERTKREGKRKRERRKGREGERKKKLLIQRAIMETSSEFCLGSNKI